MNQHTPGFPADRPDIHGLVSVKLEGGEIVAGKPIPSIRRTEK